MGRKLWVILAMAVGVALTVPDRHRESLASFAPGTVQTEPSAQIQDCAQSIVLPYAMEDGGLVAEVLTQYEGPYLEDGSDEPVSGIAALMLCNAGSRDISSAMVTVKQGRQVLHFYVTWLPAGQRALVLEYDRQMYQQAPITYCGSTGVRWEEFCPAGGSVWVTEDGGAALAVTNRSAENVGGVRLRYKTYVAEGDFYLGGFTYSTYVGELASGESRVVTPSRYAEGCSKVVAVLIQ